MRAFLLVAVITLALVATLGCSGGTETPDVPPQDYYTRLTALGQATGGVVGRILFPSEYNQRSTIFHVDDVSFVTYPDGRFWIRRVPAGTHKLHVAIKGFEPLTVPIEVAADANRPLEPIRLTAAKGRVLGRLVNDHGESAVGVEVALAPTGGVAVTDEDGIFQFIGVPGGKHTLKLADPTLFASNKHFSIDSNEKRNLGLIKVYRQITPQTQVLGRRP